MTKFTPKHITKNVNVAKGSPGIEFFRLLGGLAVVLVCVYLFLGMLLELMIDRMPQRLETALVSVMDFAKFETPKEYEETERSIQKLVDQLVSHRPELNQKYTVHIQENEMVNAFAYPGGHIVLFTGLLSAVESENELSMILAHELGHFLHKDHLRGLGRGVVFVVLYSAVFGNTAGAGDAISSLLNTAQLRLSRAQEQAADDFALNILNKHYGHVGGATDFFEQMMEDEILPEFLEFALTHPVSSNRIKRINQAILSHQYSVAELIPFSFAAHSNDE